MVAGDCCWLLVSVVGGWWLMACCWCPAARCCGGWLVAGGSAESCVSTPLGEFFRCEFRPAGIPNRANLGPTWGRRPPPPPSVDDPRSAVATSAHSRRHCENNKTTILLHRIAISGVEFVSYKLQHRSLRKRKRFEFIWNLYDLLKSVRIHVATRCFWDRYKNAQIAFDCSPIIL